MKHWFGRVMAGMWRVGTLAWVPERVRLPTRLGLLYAGTVAVLWWFLPYQPRAILSLLEPIHEVDVATDGSRIAVLYMNPASTRPEVPCIQFFDWRQPAPVFTQPAGKADSYGLRISPTGRYAVLQRKVPFDGNEADIRDQTNYVLWDLSANQKVSEISFDVNRFQGPIEIAFSLDDRAVAFACVNQRCEVSIWTHDTRRVERQLPGACPPIVFSPDGQTLLTGLRKPDPDGRGENDPSAYALWDWQTGRKLYSVMDEELTDVISMGFTPFFSGDGREVVCYAFYERGDLKRLGMKRRDVANGTLIEARYHDALTPPMAWAWARGHVVVNRENTCRLIDMQTGETRLSLPLPEEGKDDERMRYSVEPNGQRGYGGNVEWNRANVAVHGDMAVLVERRRPELPDGPWTGWDWLDGHIFRFLIRWRGTNQWKGSTTLRSLNNWWSQGHLQGWVSVGLADGGRVLVTENDEKTQLAVWDLPLRSPWVSILGWATVPPGLLVVGLLGKRAWRRAKPAAA